MIPIPDNPDPALLRRARRGEHAAFAALHGRYVHAVRAAVEARRPASKDIDRLSAGAFIRIFGRLGVLNEEHWLHRDFVRQTREYLDLEGVRHDDVGDEAPDWLRSLPIEPREALFFALRAAPCSPFPAHEYFGIARQAYDARCERAIAHRDKTGGEIPAAPDYDPIPVQWERIREALPPEPGSNTRERRFPRMPLPLSFLLVVAVSMLGLSLIFMNTGRPEQPAAFAAGPVATGTRTELVPRVHFVVARGSELWHEDWTAFELRRGRVEIEHDGWERPRIRVGSREVALSRGRFVLTRSEAGALLEVEDGQALVVWTGADGAVHRQRVLSGELAW